MTPRAIEVRIEELVLEDVAPADRLRVAGAIERELARLIREGGLGGGFAAPGVRDAIDAGAFERAPRATPAALGDAVARSVYAGLKR